MITMWLVARVVQKHNWIITGHLWIIMLIQEKSTLLDVPLRTTVWNEDALFVDE